MVVAVCWREEYVVLKPIILAMLTLAVTDMLIAILNTCSKEELEDETPSSLATRSSSSDGLSRTRFWPSAGFRACFRFCAKSRSVLLS
jgi:hypothetical protein